MDGYETGVGERDVVETRFFSVLSIGANTDATDDSVVSLRKILFRGLESSGSRWSQFPERSSRYKSCSLQASQTGLTPSFGVAPLVHTSSKSLSVRWAFKTLALRELTVHRVRRNYLVDRSRDIGLPQEVPLLYPEAAYTDGISGVHKAKRDVCLALS